MLLLLILMSLCPFALCQGKDKGKGKPAKPKKVMEPPKLDVGFRYDYWFFPSDKAYYKFFEIPTNYYDAYRICQLEGARLAAPESEKKAMSMKFFISRIPDSSRKRVFTGYNSLHLSGLYVSSSGNRLERGVYRWGWGEPRSDRDPHNALSMDQHGDMYINNFDEKFAFICYKYQEYGDVHELNKCRFRKKNKFAVEKYREQVCYRVHLSPLNYDYATQTCFGNGGNLLILRSKEQEKFLTKYKNEASKAKTVITTEDDQFYLGFHFNSTTGEWLSVFDETLQEVGYDGWKNPEPNKEVDKTCLGYPGSRYEAVLCNKPIRFFCEFRKKSTRRTDVPGDDEENEELLDDRPIRDLYKNRKHQLFIPKYVKT